MAWALDTDQVAASGPVTIPGIAGVWDADTTYAAEALGLTDAEVQAAITKLGLPIKQVSGAGLTELPADETKAPSSDAQGNEALAPQADGAVTKQAVERSDELEAEREQPDATEGALELAQKRNVDLGAVEGSGKGGRVRKADVEAAAGGEA